MKVITRLAILLMLCPLIGFQTQAQPKVYPKSFTVAQDGSADFKTIQEAVNAVRDLSQQEVTITVRKGVYNEKLVIPSWKCRITLVGEDKENTIITNSDFSGKPYGSKDAYGLEKFTTYTSYTVLVQGNDTHLKNLTIINAAGRVGQAVALHVEGDRTIVEDCILKGNQDTVYAATESSRQYYLNCYIEGTTDFIFGEATAVFDRCTIKSLSNSYITAASTTPRQKFGYVFFDCKLIAAPTATKVFLGRPWRPNAKTVFIRTEMGKHILPQGWDNWRDPANELTVIYGDYSSTGEGANPTMRVKWSNRLNKKQLKAYTISSIFEGNTAWNPTKQ